MSRMHRWVPGVLLLLLVGGACFYLLGEPIWRPIHTRLTGGRTVQDVLDQVGPEVQARLVAHFESTTVDYPPDELALVGLKEEKQLELWARDADTDWTLIHRYPVLAASGTTGPKLREGDRQVPEGIYAIEGLNPNSSYHLSMKLNYPNDRDRMHAQQDGREKPGTNIFIHGKAASVGCLAMGDPAIEELFMLVYLVGIEKVQVLLLPHDPSTKLLEATDEMPAWTEDLYKELGQKVMEIRSKHVP